MKKSNFNTRLTIFILFFGLAMTEALERHNWPEAFLFLMLGAVTFFADGGKN